MKPNIKSKKYKRHKWLNDHVFKVFEIKPDYFLSQIAKHVSVLVIISNIEKHSLKVLSGVLVV